MGHDNFPPAGSEVSLNQYFSVNPPKTGPMNSGSSSSSLMTRISLLDLGLEGFVAEDVEAFRLRMGGGLNEGGQSRLTGSSDEVEDVETQVGSLGGMACGAQG